MVADDICIFVRVSDSLAFLCMVDENSTALVLLQYWNIVIKVLVV